MILIDDAEWMIRKMTQIRVAEKAIAEQFFQQKIFSFLHLMIGQEASPVGVAAAIEKGDLMMGNHRSHGHYLAKGGNFESMVFEVFGDQRGCCKGYGGSMHMLDRSVGFEGSTPILGSAACLAVGKAFSDTVNNIDRATVVFIGDGAAEEGVFMESVNLAANKKCKTIFVIEDNKYSVNSNHMDRKSDRYRHQQVFEGLGATYSRVDGNNVFDVCHSASAARDTAMTGVPVVLHIDVNRRHGHSGPMPENSTEAYRAANDSVEYREAADCIERAKAFLVDRESIGELTIDMWIQEESALTETRFKKVIEKINVRG